MQTNESGHDPVLLQPILQALRDAPGQTLIDCTLGRAGHAKSLAPLLGPKGLLVGLDVDPKNLAYAAEQLRGAPCQVRLFHANFAELEDVLKEIDRPAVDFILADLGVSTNQIFDADYGLSFAQPMNLDMRLDPRIDRNAADLVNSLPEEELANVLYELAQERLSRRIARKIVDARRASPIKSTERLAELVRSAIPSRQANRDKIDPATRTFLALRMKVNREQENLAALLELAPQRLTRGGRLGIISFQSMEDRMVKLAFRSAERTGLLRIITKKPITPDPAELSANPRSRSAKLRLAERL